MHKTDPLKLVKSISKLASLPTIYYKIDEALQDPKTSNRLLADILSEDTALTARLLRLANSAYFNFPGKIDTVTQAIMVIGTRQLKEIVLASSIVNAFKDIPNELINMESFWRHSIACGVAARVIASLRREANVETLFVAGLLHDIGRLVLFKEKAAAMQEALESNQNSDTPLYVAEKEVLGFSHSKLGGMLLTEWRLPKRLIDTTTYHHRPLLSREYQVETSIVHIADIVAHSLELGSSGERYTQPLDTKAWEKLQLEETHIPTLIEEFHNQFSVAVEFILN